MDIKQVFSERLQHIRKMRGFSLRELAEQMGGIVSAQTISNYEKGVSFPEGKVMTALLDALNVTIDALLRPRPINWNGVEFHYRKRKSLSIMMDRQIEASVRERAERYMEIENILEITPKTDFRDICSNMSIMSSSDARQAATIVRNKYCLGEEPITSLHNFLEQAGVKLIGLRVDGKFDGVNFICGPHSFIVYNSTQESVERTRFTIAHEVGHLLLNFPDEITEKDEEKLCNSFASELLLPQNRLRSILGNRREGISLHELQRIQQIYGLSIDAILYAACEIGIITREKYKQFMVVKNVNPVIKKAVMDSLYPATEPNERFEALVYQALTNSVISISKAAGLLDLSVEVLNKKLNII